MKKFHVLIFLVILCFLMGGCGTKSDKKATTVTFYAAVIDRKDNSLCVTPVQSEFVLDSLIMIPWDSAEVVSRGTLLCIEYDGIIAESYPAIITNPISVDLYEGNDIQIDGSKFRGAYESYVQLLIHPDYPFGEEALSQFISSIEQGIPAKYVNYTIGEEGDPVFFYYDYMIDDVIGNYIVEGFDTTYDKWNAQPGITYYRFPYIYEDEYGNICVSECVDLEAYNSVINYSSGYNSYVYVNALGKGELEDNFGYDNAVPVLRINSSATATLGIDSVSNPNVITVNDKGTITTIELTDVGEYLARGVLFKTDDCFAVVCENRAENVEYLIKEYTIKNGEAVETKTYYSEEMP